MPQFQQKKLPNGLTIIAETDPAAHTAAVGFFVKTGARDEDAPLMGVSHFLEHMMFKGTPRRNADDVNREFDEMGANYNAFTSHEQTVYYAHVLPEYIPRAVDLLGDMLRPALREEDFNLEKNVILEEIGMYDDRPQWRLQDTLLDRYYGVHPLGFRVLGTVDTIKAMTHTQMRSYFEHRYSSDNIVISASGRVDFGKLCDDIERVAGGWRPTSASRRYDAPLGVAKEDTLSDAKVSRHYVAALSPAPSAQDVDRYAARVFADLLGDSEGSRLYWSLIDPGLAEEADFSFSPQDQTGNYIAYASCDPERGTEVEEILLRTIDGVAADVSDDEVERAKNKLATLAALEGERPGRRMTSLGMTWQYLGEYLPLDEELGRLMSVTAGDVRALLEQYPTRPRTVVRLTPGK